MSDNMVVLLMLVLSVSLAAGDVTLNAEPQIIQVGQTQQLHLSCALLDPAATHLTKPTSVTLFRIHDDTQQILSSVSALSRASLMPGVEAATVDGNIGSDQTNSSTYLKMTWLSPKKEVTGEYICETAGTDDTGTYVLMRTSVNVTAVLPPPQRPVILSDSEILQLCSHNQPLCTQSKEICAQYPELCTEIRQLCTTNQNLCTDIQHLGSHSQQLGSQNQDLGQQNQQLGTQNQQLGAQSQHLNQQNQLLGSQIQQMGAHIQELGSQIQQLGSENQALGSQNQQLGSQSQALGAQTQQLGSQNQQLGSQVQKLDSQLQQLEQQLAN